MSWDDFYAARLLLAEERVGTRVQEIEDEEDRALARARQFASRT